ncbi:hypothetical protein [Isoptericola aurantiacus]|uniref:hypothetical protein n=1 Tax=Isoptericola aurantiacus TaxID=3377839 RepID=UPI00383AF87E
MAVWPVVDDTVALDDLLAEARSDVRDVAWRHGFELVAAGSPVLREGRTVAGSGGAEFVVTVSAFVRARTTELGVPA